MKVKKNTTNLIKGFAFFLLLFLFFACSSKKNDTHKNHMVFRYNEVNNIKSLDPAFAKDLSTIWPVNQIFNGLVQLDENLNIKPDLATSWSIDSTFTVYQFHLRSDVYFHKDPVFGEKRTRQVTAQDVVYSLNRIKDKETASPGAWVMQKVVGLKAIEPFLLEIKLNEPFPAFLSLLTMKYCSVVPEEAIRKYSEDFRKHPIGTGPFLFKYWEENTKLVLRKNPLYYEFDEKGNRLPYLESIAITFLPDKQSEFLQFLMGNLDFISGIDASYKDELLSYTGELNSKYKDRMSFLRTAYLNTEYLGFNMKDALPHEIRTAINYGFDRKEMIKYLRNGIGVPAENGFVPPVLLGKRIKGYSYNPEKAKKLVENYRKKNNKIPEVNLSTTAQYVDLCEYIQNALAVLPIKVNINLMTPSTLRQLKAQTKLPFFRASWIADYPDAENFLSLYYSENKTPNGPNYTHFHNESFDALFLKALKTKKSNYRKKLYASLDSLIVDQAPIVPLYYDEVVRFVSPKVQDLGINAINLLQLKQVKKSP